MKKRKHRLLLGLFMVGSLAFVGCSQPQETVGETVQTFADYFEDEYFEKLPAMQVANGQVENPWKIQNDVRMLGINGAQYEEYQQYVNLLEEHGYEIYAENGEEGIGNGAVYNTMLTKDEWVVTVVYLTNQDKATVTVMKEAPLSEHLIYKDSYKENFVDGQQTVLHMPELSLQGDCYILQLKNGHFVVTDGGTGDDAQYLVEYLESLVPEGEKPVIEAWTISHPHWDHYGSFHTIGSDVELASRLIVEEVYYCGLNAETAEQTQTSQDTQTIEQGFRMFKTSKGTAPKIHRPQPGQRYYFADITMDVLFTNDYVTYNNYKTPDANEASTWWMYTIGEQTFLLGSDADYGNQRAIMRVYDSEYFQVDIYSALHHGINVYDNFTDFIGVKTLLYPNRIGNTKIAVAGSIVDAATHDPAIKTPSRLYGKAQEWMYYGDGGNVLTFPYEVGTAKKLAPRNLAEDAQ